MSATVSAKVSAGVTVSAPGVADPDDAGGAPAEEVHGVAGWALRLALAVAALALVAAAVDPRVWPVGTYVVLGLLALAAALLPGTSATIALLVAAAACQLFTDGVTLGPRLVVTAVLLDAVHVLAALAGPIPLRARVDPGALVPSGRRFLVVLALSVPVFAADRFVGIGSGSGLLFLATAVAALAVVVTAAVVAARRRP